MRRFLLAFIALQAVLWSATTLQPFQTLVVVPLTSLIARMCTTVFAWSTSSVTVVGHIVRDTLGGFAVSIDPSCLAVGPSLLLVGALLAYPEGWRRKLVGVVAGLMLVQLVNLLRIISLFYLGMWDRTWYPVAHDYIAPLLVMIAVIVIFEIWIPKRPNMKVTDKSAARPV